MAGDIPGSIDVDVCDDDACVAASELPSARFTDAAGAAGDDG